MERDILALINKENHKFSKGQRMICRYISENYDKAAFMTAGEGPQRGGEPGIQNVLVLRQMRAAALGADGRRFGIDGRPLCYGAWVCRVPGYAARHAGDDPQPSYGGAAH